MDSDKSPMMWEGRVRQYTKERERVWKAARGIESEKKACENRMT